MDPDLIQKLISVMDENGLTELHYEQEGTVVRLSRQSGAPASSVSTGISPAASVEGAGEPSVDPGLRESFDVEDLPF